VNAQAVGTAGPIGGFEARDGRVVTVDLRAAGTSAHILPASGSAALHFFAGSSPGRSRHSPPSGRAPHNERAWLSTQDPTVMPMGDKSPKAKEKSKKQDTAGKNQKKAAASAKAAAPSTGTAKKK
jgi:hypothetical protein